jgi:hypothetical protein
MPNTSWQDLDDLVQELPEAVTRSEVMAAAGRRVLLAPWRPLTPIRRLVGMSLHTQGREREALEDRWLLHLLLCFRMMTQPWAVYRRTIDGLARETPPGRFQETQQWLDAMRELDRVLKEGEAALAALRGQVEGLEQRLLPKVSWPGAGGARSTSSPASRVATLRRVEAELRLSWAVNLCTVGVLDSLVAGVEDIEGERGSLLRDLDDVLRWLRVRQEGGTGQAFPEPGTVVNPASNRAARFESRMEDGIAQLPEETLPAGRLGRSLARGRRIRPLKPRQVARRAREVVAFAESEAVAGAETGALTQEAIQHSLALVEFSRGELSSWRPDIEARLVGAVAEAFAEIHLMLGRDWLSVQAYIVDRGLHRGLALGRRVAADTLSRLANRVTTWAEMGGRHFLERIGWKARAQAGEADVVTRAVLPKEFAADVGTIALPALYRRLFRPEPVEDIRFLVGRERELAAIAEARAFWEEW